MKLSAKKVAKRFGLAAFLFFFIKGLVWLAIFFGAAKLFWPKSATKELAVWEAHARDSASQALRFHLVVPAAEPDTASILHYGRQYLQDKEWAYQQLEVRYCPSCTFEKRKTEVTQIIKEKGFAAYEVFAD